MGATNTDPTSNLQKLQEFLRELFQFDLADLDFGIYRLLNLKRGEVEAFLTDDLPRRVEEAFKQASGADLAEVQRRIEQLAERVRNDIDPDAIAETGEVRAEFKDQKAKATRSLIADYQAAREQLRQSQATEEDKAEVFQHVLSFFSRYYDGGDFIPRCQRTRENYAVPWNGEETLFHWANKGQHYVKTGETFRDYTFTVAGIAGEYRIRFVLSDADLPPGNTKGDTRYFFPLPREIAYDEPTRILRAPFHYRLPTAEETAKHGKTNRIQDAILDEALPRILKAVPDAFLQEALAAKEGPKPENGDSDKRPTLLLRRLRHFCKKNTTDYFITPNLAGFLTAELDYYLKDQVINVHDLEGDFERKRRILRVIHALAADITRFLSQIEDVQNRLFEKRKFVLRTDYLVTLKAVPREFWKEIIANKDQLDEWKRLFAIEPRQDLLNRAGKVNEDFLAEYPTLVVNTALFDADFTARLLATFNDLDDETDGILIHSENYQALRFMEPRFAGQIKCIYIDPPYNTGDSEILYKNGYLSSSWLTLMEDRVAVSVRMLSEDPVVFIAIDDFEMVDLCELMDKRFPFLRREMIVVNHHPQGGKAKTLANTHEYMLVCVAKSSDRTLVGRLGTDGVENRPFKRSGTAESNFRYARPNSFYAVLVNPKTKTVVGVEPPPRVGEKYPTGRTAQGLERVYPLGSKDEERVWRRSYESCLLLIAAGKLKCSDNMTIYQCIEALDRTSALFSNWIGTRYNAGVYGANLLADVIGAHNPFSYPKSIHTVEDALYASGIEDNAICLDYFGGSGTTGHAIIDLNRQDGENRRFILIEMGKYFDTVLVPRIAKVTFTPEWKAGKPVRRATAEEAERSPRIVKVLRLEAYEDALHNLTTNATKAREQKRAEAVAKRVGEPEHRLSYLLRLPLEANACLLNIAALEHPFDYTLETLTENGPQVRRVDLIETFNWLYGLRVHRLRTWNNPKDKRTYRVVEATRGRDTHVLVIWRDMTDLDPGVERAFIAAQLKTAGDFDERWINGDCAAGFQSLDGLFKDLIGGVVR